MQNGVKVLQIGGRWDDKGGKTSGFANKLFNELNILWRIPGHPLAHFGATPITANGGDWDTLPTVMSIGSCGLGRT